MTVELVFGQVERGRGFGQFLLRGLGNLDRKPSLICTDHDIPKLSRFEAALPGKVLGNGAARNIKQSSRSRSDVMLQRLLAGLYLPPAYLAIAGRFHLTRNRSQSFLLRAAAVD